jgi:hypothetical protein
METLHSDIIAPSLHHLCADVKKVRWLPKLATGEIILAVAITEPDPGSDLPGIRTRTIGTGTTETMKYIIAKNLRLVQPPDSNPTPRGSKTEGSDLTMTSLAYDNA